MSHPSIPSDSPVNDNEGCDIFSDDEDREIFLSLLGDMSEYFNKEVHSWVLMSNHYHLLLRTRAANLSKGMQWFGATYTRRYNLKHICFNIAGILVKASQLLECDLISFKETRRISQSDKVKRDIMIYLLWRAGAFTNKEIGANFGLSYSAFYP